MIWETVYPSIALHINNIIAYPPASMLYARLALKDIVDISGSTEEVMIVETTILPIVYDLYLHVYGFEYHEMYVKLAIEKINEFTVKNYGDIDDFINSLTWDRGCVPHHWADYSEELGYDTSGWPTCS